MLIENQSAIKFVSKKRRYDKCDLFKSMKR
jgi:hypothetical protein